MPTPDLEPFIQEEPDEGEPWESYEGEGYEEGEEDGED